MKEIFKNKKYSSSLFDPVLLLKGHVMNKTAEEMEEMYIEVEEVLKKHSFEIEKISNQNLFHSMKREANKFHQLKELLRN